MIPFRKYHGLGNDYLVLDPKDQPNMYTAVQTERICHRNYGLGSDGILYGPLPSSCADFCLQIFNPDGSEAEKSGNGLRIFARYLYDIGAVKEESPFHIETLGGTVRCVVHAGGDQITVEMGKVSFDSAKIPVAGPQREVINETITIDGTDYTFCAATIGNPHCVLPMNDISAALAHKLGPVIETEKRFPRRTNVQFLKVLDNHNIQIEIWERGAGYTLASGSSSSAAGAVALRLGLVQSPITVHMPGGQIQLTIDENFAVTMTGPVSPVGNMQLHSEFQF